MRRRPVDAGAARDRIVSQRPLTALVTGASSGIGRDFARLLAEHHHDLVLVARRTDPMKHPAAELESAHGIRATVIGADLADPGTPARLEAELAGSGVDVDVLVNNAGYTMDGHFLSYRWEEHEAYVRVMAVAPSELVHRFLPGMLGRGFGQVINIASVAGIMPATPFNALYGPSKNYLVVLTRSLATEYGRAGVTFTVCCPGPVTDTAIIDSGHGKAWARFTFILSSPRQVTEKAYAAAQSGKPLQLVGAATRSVSIYNRLLPTNAWVKASAAGIMFLGKEKPITSWPQ